ncbi:MAG: hypothetical protein ACXVZR_08500 [Terriglobales bacterium]|jgi:hypothetical protein
MPHSAAAKLTMSRERRLSINDDLQTLSQVLYLVGVGLPPHMADLNGFVQLGKSAVRHLAETFSDVDAVAPDPAGSSHQLRTATSSR